jgi:hypothetical protein
LIQVYLLTNAVELEVLNVGVGLVECGNAVGDVADPDEPAAMSLIIWARARGRSRKYLLPTGLVMI